MGREKQQLRRVDDYLKNLYLGTVRDALDTCHPILARIEQTSNDVWGKDICKLECCESDANGKTNQYVSSLKRIYMVLKLPNEMAFVDDRAMMYTVNKAISNMQNSARQVMSLELFSDGCGHIEHRMFNGIHNNFVFLPQKISGLGYIFNNDRSLYGLKRDRDSRKACILDWGEKSGNRLLNDLTDKVTESNCDVIVTSSKVRQHIQNTLIANRQNIDILSFNGHKAISINGVPLFADKNCTDDIYILNTQDFKLERLHDWLWLEDDDGSIIHKMSISDGYYAVLVKYVDLLCENVQNQTRIKVNI